MKIKMKIEHLLPTQFCLGFNEVKFKVEKLNKMRSNLEKFDKYMFEKIVPIVKGPQGKMYLIDHHHHIKSLLEIGIDWVYVVIQADYSHLDEADFVRQMKKSKYLNLNDENGKTKKFSELPKKVSELKHDWYRSLAWAVREEDGFKKVDEIPFFEFRWGDFYRQYITLELIKMDFKLSTEIAHIISKSELASHLPGYLKK